MPDNPSTALAFRNALDYFQQMEGHGFNRSLSVRTGLSEQYISRLLNGQKKGTEETRRKIAAAFGYSGSNYEEFLNIGRKRLGEDEFSDDPPDPLPPSVPQWLFPYLPDLAALDKPGQAAVKALLNGLKAQKER
jgi:transcriptional regulator with XRE-family HTH domain